MKKEYVPALIRFDETGAMTPIYFKPKEKWLKIDQIFEVRRMPFETGGAGIRYTIRVGKTLSHLMYDTFMEPLQWFVEVDESMLIPGSI